MTAAHVGAGGPATPVEPLPFVDLAAQAQRLGGAIPAAIARVLEHGAFVNGPEILELETRLAARGGVAHAVSCASGTDALLMALFALGVGPGDRVAVPSFTFAATVEAVVLAGAEPVFVDVRDDTFCIDVEDLDAVMSAAAAEGRAVTGVIPVDLFGLPADPPGVADAARRHGAWVVVDAAQSFGAAWGGTPSTAFGVMATTSFFPAKPLGCYGDGGAVLTDDGELADLLRSIRQHGQGEHRYEHARVGWTARLDTIQAAVLLEKLEVFDDELVARDAAAALYSELLAPAAVVPAVPEPARSAWAQYTLRLGGPAASRDAVAAALATEGVPTAVYYPVPMHMQPAYRGLHGGRSLAVTERLCAEVLSIPMHPYLTRAVQERVAEAVISAVSAGGRTAGEGSVRAAPVAPTVGPDFFVHGSAELDPAAQVGEGTQIWNWTKVREGARVGAGCRVGQGVYIDHGVTIGDGCKIQNNVSVYAGVEIGDRVFVGPHATFTNDLFPRAAGEDWQIVPTVVEDDASIGANATVVCGTRLGRGCMVGAGAVVTTDVEPFALVVGNPARRVGWVDLDGHRADFTTPEGPAEPAGTAPGPTGGEADGGTSEGAPHRRSALAQDGVDPA